VSLSLFELPEVVLLLLLLLLLLPANSCHQLGIHM
jgi:hypothetical protein